MDQVCLSSNSILDTLLKTNRPLTDQDKAMILESMAPTNAKLKVVEAQISEAMAHIEALKSQIEATEIKLQRLHEEKAAIWETSADHRRALNSPIRNLPEDVLREICATCVEEGPTLAYGSTPLPYILSQISSGMRHIALTTPAVWASMTIDVNAFGYRRKLLDERAYLALARRASEWFERAGPGGLALMVYMEQDETVTSSILFQALLRYSTRWKEIQVYSSCLSSKSMDRIAALTAADVPLLQSVSLRLVGDMPLLQNSIFLTIPTLKHIALHTDHVPKFTVNWAVLTSVTLHEKFRSHRSSQGEIARILQQTKCLVFCNIAVGPVSAQDYPGEIDLPFLETLFVYERHSGETSSGASSILDLITAPVLGIFHIRERFLDFSLSEFFKRSPNIWKLSLPYLNGDKSLMDMAGLLHHCSSLTVLSLRPCEWERGVSISNRNVDNFLRAFVEETGVGATCPRLQHFRFRGGTDFSLQTLRTFLENKEGDIATQNSLLAWKSVVISLTGIKDKEIQKQMLDFVSQKKTAGLEIDAFTREEMHHIDSHFYQWKPQASYP
ncbi:hypothetical protein HYPSUDRAFT_426556 [Hypholoma sublateritium FD-334 SS-4]|uniref:F-box domain-containing protein n=1 Tax=Hypholoma sublateritium (strain FD-334 SS-4) TaxID=945553 RepID=A0A0D2LDA7_HYPSF|nr:hypothetical protein HYPSUDRAFT_426556 [Hypholoma sublateritium FD-334 SS-4]